ncbi:MAG: hypothetical protein mread185_000239 [Mycoplasmataceae bacterium]|nr:MAG: hypothetical protein mread185_000239 [Mycoplasmataceae bacterium]
MLQYSSQLSEFDELAGFHSAFFYPAIQKSTNIENYFDATSYLLSIDRNRDYFIREPLEKGLIDENVTKENFRLNKLLHLSNILYYTKKGERIFEEKFCSLTHGAVIEEVFYRIDKDNYFRLSLEENSNSYEYSIIDEIDKGKESILQGVFNCFSQYSDQQLILFSQEDPAWEIARKKGEKYLLIDEKIIKFYQTFYQHVLEEIDYSE